MEPDDDIDDIDAEYEAEAALAAAVAEQQREDKLDDIAITGALADLNERQRSRLAERNYLERAWRRLLFEQKRLALMLRDHGITPEDA